MTDGNSGRRVTIRQVAARAGVSVSAVSKVMRDAYGVSSSMRARVTAAMADLQYRPLASARGLRGRTYSVGVILPDIRNPFFAEILNGAAVRLGTAHYQMILGVREASGSEAAAIESMLDRQVDGIAIVGTELSQDQLERLGSRIPLVAVGHHAPARSTSFDTVNNDDVLGARLAVRHLLAQGFVEVTMLSLAGTNSTVIARREAGYRLEMEENNPAGQVRILRSAASPHEVAAAVEKLLTSRTRRSAVFCWCDLVAFQFMSAALEAGLIIPKDIGVIGYDDSALCDLSQHRLTSIHQSGSELGEQAAALLAQRLSGRTGPAHILVGPWVAARQSTMVPLSI
jgi:DNA-binding LacI/PurR family transcriptional regulator